MDRPTEDTYNRFIFPISFLAICILIILGIIFTPETFSAIVLIVLLLWIYKTARAIILCTINYTKIETNTLYDWSKRLGQIEDIQIYIETVENDISLLEKQFHFNTYSAFQKLFVHFTNFSKFYSTYISLKKELAKARRLKPSEIMKPSGIINLLLIPAYKEPIDTLSRTLEAIKEQDYPKGQLRIVLALEDRDPTADTIATQVKEKFSKDFPYIYTTKHVLQPSEKTGKASNGRYALQEVMHILESEGVDKKNVIVTTTDADVIFGKHYFSCLTFSFCMDKHRATSLYHAAPVFLYNYKELTAIGQISATLNTIGTIAWLKNKYQHPQSTYALSLETFNDIGLWDPTIMSDDEYVYQKMFFTFNRKFALSPLFVSIYMSGPSSEKYLSSLKSLYQQIQRWTYGMLMLNQNLFQNFTNNESLSFKDRLLFSLEKIEKTILWPFYNLAVVFGFAIIQIIRSSFTSSLFTIAIRYATIVTTVVNLFLLAFIIGIDYYIRSKEEFSKMKPHSEILHLFRWLYFPLASLYLGFIPYIDVNLRIVLGRALEFKRTAKGSAAKE